MLVAANSHTLYLTYICFIYKSGYGEYTTTYTKYCTIIVHELCCKYITGVVHATVSEYDYHVMNNMSRITFTPLHTHITAPLDTMFIYSTAYMYTTIVSDTTLSLGPVKAQLLLCN